MNDHTEKALAEQIKVAFADVPYPGDENIVRPEEASLPEWDEVAQAFRGKHWRELTIEFLLNHHAAVSVFTPEAYLFYLPAFLVISILEYEKAGLIPEFTIYDLNPAEELKNGLQFQQRIEGMTASQRRAVKSFLEFMREFHGECLEDDIDRALKNLEPTKGTNN